MPGYFWIFPVNENEANVGVGMVMQEMKNRSINLQEAMFKAIQEDRLFCDRFKDAELLGEVRGWNLPLGSTRRQIHGNGFMLVGDAAGLIDPFSGEGIGNAMVSGKFAAETLAQAFKANDFSKQFLQRYPDRLWAEIWPELKTSYDMQRLGKFKFLLNFFMSKAAKSPRVRDMISGSITNEEAKKEFTSLLFYLKLLFT
jgi:flavin-dependent dehydrogenase